MNSSIEIQCSRFRFIECLKYNQEKDDEEFPVISQKKIGEEIRPE